MLHCVRVPLPFLCDLICTCVILVQPPVPPLHVWMHLLFSCLKRETSGCASCRPPTTSLRPTRLPSSGRTSWTRSGGGDRRWWAASNTRTTTPTRWTSASPALGRRHCEWDGTRGAAAGPRRSGASGSLGWGQQPGACSAPPPFGQVFPLVGCGVPAGGLAPIAASVGGRAAGGGSGAKGKERAAPRKGGLSMFLSGEAQPHGQRASTCQMAKCKCLTPLIPLLAPPRAGVLEA